MTGNVTFRIDKGTALTYQELDDNFRAIAGEPHIRWLKLKGVTPNIVVDNTTVSEATIKWSNIVHTDTAHFSINTENSEITILKNGIYEVSSSVTILHVADSSTHSNIVLQLLKNDAVVIETFEIPNFNTESYKTLHIFTTDYLEVNDILKLKFLNQNDSTNAVYTIASEKGEFIMKWLGYNPPQP
jgi:hypothetical protein